MRTPEEVRAVFVAYAAVRDANEKAGLPVEFAALVTSTLGWVLGAELEAKVDFDDVVARARRIMGPEFERRMARAKEVVG